MMILEAGFVRQRAAPSFKLAVRDELHADRARRAMLFENGDAVISFAF